jgi:hypothetical protein
MKGYIANPTTKKHHNMLRFTSSLRGTKALYTYNKQKNPTCIK